MTSMKKGWIEHVWELSSKESVKATDYNIIQKYKCPIFFNINVTSSLLSIEEKAIISEKINENGNILFNIIIFFLSITFLITVV